MLISPFLARNITFSAVFFLHERIWRWVFVFDGETPFCRFHIAAVAPFLLLEQIEGSLIVMHQKFKRGFDLQKGLRK